MPGEELTNVDETTPEGDLPAEEVQEIEKKARRLGWVPKDEFRGDETRWIDADKFVERGETEIPLMRNDISRLHKQIDEMQGTFKEFSEYHRQTEKRAYDRARADIEAEMKAAVSEGDLEKYDKANKELNDLKPPPEQTNTQPVDPLFTQWHATNQWYNKDVWMTADADKVSNVLANSRSDLQGIDLYNEVTKEIVKKYPESFSNPRRNEPDELGNPPSGPSGKKNYANMDKEARDTCDRFVKEGLMKQEEYVKTYWEETQ
jgi:hypothetical protein